MIKVARMRWLWYVIRTYVGTVHEQLLIAEPWGRRWAGQPRLWWLECV